MKTGSIWEINEFPVRNIEVNSGYGDKWFAAKATLEKPYCWTPESTFWFGGKQFKVGYPCAAHATQNFGFIVQKTPDGLIMGKL